jgi:hypothetical protein
MPAVLLFEHAADEMLFILGDAPQFRGGESVKMASCNRDFNSQAIHICASCETACHIQVVTRLPFRKTDRESHYARRRCRFSKRPDQRAGDRKGQQERRHKQARPQARPRRRMSSNSVWKKQTRRGNKDAAAEDILAMSGPESSGFSVFFWRRPS